MYGSCGASTTCANVALYETDTSSAGGLCSTVCINNKGISVDNY